MSAIQYCKSIAIFQGAQGKFYIVNGVKYHYRFPIDWAHKHMTFTRTIINKKTGVKTTREIMTGPINCENCKSRGSIRDVFVGYCSTCLQHYLNNGELRGRIVAPGLFVELLADLTIWEQYPYMFGICKPEIGDIEDDVNTDILFEPLIRPEITDDSSCDDIENDITGCDDSPDCKNISDDESAIITSQIMF